MKKNLNTLLFSILAAIYLSACGAAYKGPVSDHFDGSEFYNPEPSGHSFTDMLKWFWEMDTVDWPDQIEDPEQPAPPEKVGKGDLRVTFINHATLLIQMDNLNILTDPVWSKRVGPTSWLGPERVRAPGVPMENLPRIDYVLISHDHYDHLDKPTIEKLVRRDSPVFLVGLGVSSHLDDEGISHIEEMDWWQSFTPGDTDLTFTFVPARHQSGRGPFSENATLWGGYVIESPGGQVYYAGDTAFGKFVRDIGRRFTRIKLAILPIGSYEARWFMKNQHMNPDDAVQAHMILKAAQSVGMHFGTFAEHPEQTVDQHEHDLADALKKYNIPRSEFRVLQFGEGIFLK
ncbi:MBL fold metallo-hydrolase [Desulfococcaceae bacterium HSG8]|nr:MBL fold metallo-hydrolase [Desulfococcaceae bacterium HSG8]